MSTHELILLSPYRLPTHHTLYLADDDVAAFLNGLAALWHPAALRGAAGPPRVASPYDHEEPKPGVVYATPESPPLLLPDDWNFRVAPGRVRRLQGRTRPQRHPGQSQGGFAFPHGRRRRAGPAARPGRGAGGAVPRPRLRPCHAGSAVRGHVAREHAGRRRLLEGRAGRRRRPVRRRRRRPAPLPHRRRRTDALGPRRALSRLRSSGRSGPARRRPPRRPVAGLV